MTCITFFSGVFNAVSPLPWNAELSGRWLWDMMHGIPCGVWYDLWKVPALFLTIMYLALLTVQTSILLIQRRQSHKLLVYARRFHWIQWHGKFSMPLPDISDFADMLPAILTSVKSTFQVRERKFKNRVKRYVGIWCCVMDHTPGHIYYDMYWDEKPSWKPLPPQTPEDDHPPL